MSDKSASSESSLYANLGASSSKAGVHAALDHAVSHQFFATVSKDVCGDPDYYSLLHADGSGTKSLVAYLAWKETGDVSWFEGIAQDALVMNIDDVACVNAFDSLLLSNTIGRNKFTISDEVIGALISGYQKTAAMLEAQGVSIELAGGETADMGDIIRTVVVDSTLFARVKKADAIDTNRIVPGDIIVGLSSLGQASFETKPNSGMGSNGMTLARHALLSKSYAERYPEILDASLAEAAAAYAGPYQLSDSPEGLGMTVGEALLSPTRPFAPILKSVATTLGTELHGAIHNTGGGLTKSCRFGNGVHYVKDNLLPVPPLFSLIKEATGAGWQDLYSVFNMGQRIELVCPEAQVDTVIAIAKEYQIDAAPIGHVEASGDGVNKVTVTHEGNSFEYKV